MTMGAIIQSKRKQCLLTQEMLANHLGVTNQAVSKWEQNACYPDITLLPMLAELFDCSIDELFDRQADISRIPWENDDTLYLAAFRGHRLLTKQPGSTQRPRFEFTGCVQNLCVYGDLVCDRVLGSIQADGNVTSDDVGGSIEASGGVTCDNVKGSVTAGGNVTCDTIEGDVRAGGNIQCDEIFSSSISAGGNVYADHIESNEA